MIMVEGRSVERVSFLPSLMAFNPRDCVMYDISSVELIFQSLKGSGVLLHFFDSPPKKSQKVYDYM